MTQTNRYTSDENSETIRSDIEQTRNQMSSRIDRIQERMNPDHLRHQAQETVRTAMHEGTDAVVGYVREHAPDFGGTLFAAIKRNPVPAALIGLGAGWILYDSLSGHGQGNGGSYYNRGYTYSDQYGYNPVTYQQSSDYGWSGHEQRGVVGQVRHQAEQVAGAVGDKVSQVTGAVSDTVEQVTSTVGDKVGQVTDRVQDLGDQTRYGVRQVGSQAQNLVESNPVSLGLAALAIGAAIGLVLPATRRESQVMGQWRDQVVEKAQHVAGDVKQRMQEVVDEVKPELQAVASKVVDDVKETGKAAVSEAKDVAKRAGTIAQDKLGETVSTSFGSAKQREPESEGSASSAS